MKKNVSTLLRRIRAGILAVMCLATSYLSTADAQGSSYTLSKGDQLLVTVWGYNEFTTTATVKENGMFAMPLLGDMKAAGLTKEEFISNLQKKLAEYIQGDVRITISVLASLGQRVTILGAVNKPESYPVATDINLLELISMAGGYSPDARLSKVKIFHKNRELTTDVDLDDFIERADIRNIPKVEAGDIVFVPRQQNFVRDFGEFFRDVTFLFTLFQFTNGFR